MKPFGIRLAAGAVTILLGALAAAQAQKDRQQDPDSTWTAADNAVLQTPPSPIAAFQDPPWESAPLPGGSPSQTFPAGPLDSIQLVQHTEDIPPINSAPMNAAPASSDHPMRVNPDPPALAGFDPSALPESLQLPGGSADGPPQAAMGMPAFPAPETGAAGGPMSMSLPAMMPMSTGQTVGNSASPSEMALPDAAFAVDAPAMRFDSNAYPDPTGPDSLSADQLAADDPEAPPSMASSGAELPELQMEGPPGFGGVELPQAAAIVAAGANLLRGGMSEGEAETPPPTPATPSNFAAPPSMSFASPASMTAPSADENAAPRVASLPMNAPVAQPPSLSEPPSLSSYGAPQSMQSPNGASAMEAGPLAPPSALAPSAPSALAPSADPTHGTVNAPGDRRLEGVQSPSVVIHKRAPSEVKVGMPASFVIQVQNVGGVEALDVQVRDRIPAGMRLVDASPSPVMQGDALLWELGSLPAGAERTVTMQLVADEEGELGSVARVTFEAAASVRTISTRPQLQIVQRAPATVMIGQQVEIELEVSNPGTGDAIGVVLQADVPEGLEHPKGRQLDNVLGQLRAGEVRRQILRLKAVSPGTIRNVVRLTSDEGLSAEHSIEFQVVAPNLSVELAGPSRRYLERQATYQLDLANTGTADATNVELVAYLDRGFTFISTDYEGQYDPSQHAVFWSLAQLPEGARGQVPLTLLPVEEGQRTIRLEARADLGVVAKSERNVVIDALAELTFQIADSADPIEVGSETTYEIRLTNRGSKNDSNVQLSLQLPTGLELVSSEGDAVTDGRGLVQFAPASKLDSGQEAIYRVRVRGVAPGTHLTRATIVSDQSGVPVTKEESTMVYADR